MKNTPDTRALRDRPVDETLPSYGVAILESHHSPQFTMQWRTHSFIKIVYVLRGSGRFEFPTQTIPFRAADVIVVPPETANRIVDDHDSASSLYVCCIRTDLLDFDRSILSRMCLCQHDAGPPESNRIATLMRRMRHEQTRGDDSVSLSIVADALRLLAWVSRRSQESFMQRRSESADHDAMREYVRRLDSEFFEARSIDEAAEELGISRRSFTSQFHSITGETWLHRVRRLAIAHAKKLLSDSELPVASVAFECGFNDLSTFYRQFKSQTGRSPSRYRKDARANRSGRHC
ncbi:helix-turn-helix domain-containing protein [Stieleria varia]|uniref:HTH-type transcriptional activator Btr n=1 Tax=Stieleria varia TaxID=2528005 RepID=A0A5C6B8S9_9BACT|nr:AraC family transcriptional regulator [Stieleria varia]TWU07666.1 HTH-type transcriptional activator Btr [Stieleria varia]